MSTHPVSLISDHLLPNDLFIKEMKNKYDDLLLPKKCKTSVLTQALKNAKEIFQSTLKL